MFSFLLWCILFVLCWPAAIIALILFPIVWLLLLPFRLLGIAVGGVLQLVKAVRLVSRSVVEHAVSSLVTWSTGMNLALSGH